MKEKKLIETLRDLDMLPRPYSGRNMYGKVCVSVNLNGNSELFALGIKFGLKGMIAITPHTDCMGFGIVAYWPEFEWPEDSGILP